MSFEQSQKLDIRNKIALEDEEELSSIKSSSSAQQDNKKISPYSNQANPTIRSPLRNIITRVTVEDIPENLEEKTKMDVQLDKISKEKNLKTSTNAPSSISGLFNRSNESPSNLPPTNSPSTNEAPSTSPVSPTYDYDINEQDTMNQDGDDESDESEDDNLELFQDYLNFLDRNDTSKGVSRSSSIFSSQSGNTVSSNYRDVEEGTSSPGGQTTLAKKKGNGRSRWRWLWIHFLRIIGMGRCINTSYAYRHMVHHDNMNHYQNLKDEAGFNSENEQEVTGMKKSSITTMPSQTPMITIEDGDEGMKTPRAYYWIRLFLLIVILNALIMIPFIAALSAEAEGFPFVRVFQSDHYSFSLFFCRSLSVLLLLFMDSLFLGHGLFTLLKRWSKDRSTDAYQASRFHQIIKRCHLALVLLIWTITMSISWQVIAPSFCDGVLIELLEDPSDPASLLPHVIPPPNITSCLNSIMIVRDILIGLAVTSLALVIEKWCLQVISIQFHRSAYEKRLSESQYALYVVHQLKTLALKNIAMTNNVMYNAGGNVMKVLPNLVVGGINDAWGTITSWMTLNPRKPLTSFQNNTNNQEHKKDIIASSSLDPLVKGKGMKRNLLSPPVPSSMSSIQSIQSYQVKPLLPSIKEEEKGRTKKIQEPKASDALPSIPYYFSSAQNKTLPSAPTKLKKFRSLHTFEKYLKKPSESSNNNQSLSDKNINSSTGRRLIKRTLRTSSLIFYALCPPDRHSFGIEDFYPFFKTQRGAQQAFALFTPPPHSLDFRIKKRQLSRSLLSIYLEKETLTKSLLDTEDVLAVLDRLLLGAFGFLTFLIWMVLFNVGFQTTLTLMLSMMTASVFVIGDSAKGAFTSTIYLFCLHPYDVGDKVSIDDESGLIVKKIHLLMTSFITSDGRMVYYPNSFLASRRLINISRSPDQYDTLEFKVSYYGTEIPASNTAMNGLSRFDSMSSSAIGLSSPLSSIPRSSAIALGQVPSTLSRASLASPPSSDHPFQPSLTAAHLASKISTLKTHIQSYLTRHPEDFHPSLFLEPISFKHGEFIVFSLIVQQRSNGHSSLWYHRHGKLLLAVMKALHLCGLKYDNEKKVTLSQPSHYSTISSDQSSISKDHHRSFSHLHKIN